MLISLLWRRAGLPTLAKVLPHGLGVSLEVPFGVAPETHDFRGFPSAPERTRTSTDHTVHKALNLARLPIPPQALGGQYIRGRGGRLGPASSKPGGPTGKRARANVPAVGVRVIAPGGEAPQ